MIALCGSVLATGGCSSGGADSPFGGGGGTPETSLAAKSAFSPDDIDHLLARTHFGVTAADRARATGMGVPAFVDAMMQFPAIDSTTWEQDARQWLLDPNDPPGLEGMFPRREYITRWWLHMMIRNPNAFQEKVAMFWHDHFATSSDSLSSCQRRWMVDHINIFRAQGVGSFRQMLLDVSRDHAMLDWLDGRISTKTDPNENFGREFFELFTVGVDNGYTEDDIQEAARAFTGYRERFDSVTGLCNIEFDETRKDVGAKVLFQNVVLRSNPAQQDDFNLVVDATLQHLDPAGFLAFKILEYFAMENPPQALVDGLAQVMRDSNYELGPVFRTLFLSEAFYSADAKSGLVRDPLDFAVGFVRTTGLQIEIDRFEYEVRLLAHNPSRPPGVDGWPSGDAWLSAQGMVQRANFARQCITRRTFQTQNGYDVLMPSSTPTAEEVVDHFTGLFRVDPSASERDHYIEFLNTRVESNGVLAVDPFDPTDTRHIDERVRGLLFVLAQHPNCMIR